METLKKILAIIFAALFILTSVLSLFLFTFENRAFRAETYQQVFASEDFYNRIPALLAQAMVSAANESRNVPLVIKGLSVKAWGDFFRTTLPQDELKSIGDDTLVRMFDYLNLRTNTVDLSLLPIKANLGSENSVQAVFTLLQTQPACTAEQIAQITFNLFNGQDIALCNPPAALTPILTPVIKAQLQTAAQVLPDTVTILDSANLQKDPRTRLQNARTLMKISPILPIGFLILLTISIVDSFGTFLTWWGIPLLSSGTLTFLMGLSGAPLLGTLLRVIITYRAPTFLPSIFSTYASDLATAMIQAVTRPVMWEGMVLFFVGLGMVLPVVYRHWRASH